MVDRYSLYQESKEIKDLINRLNYLYSNKKYKLRKIERNFNGLITYCVIFFTVALLGILFFLYLDNFKSHHMVMLFIYITMVFSILFFTLLISSTIISLYYAKKDGFLKYALHRNVIYDFINLDNILFFENNTLTMLDKLLKYQIEREGYVFKQIVGVISLISLDILSNLFTEYKGLFETFEARIDNAYFWMSIFTIIFMFIILRIVLSILRIDKYKFYIYIVELALFKKNNYV